MKVGAFGYFLLMFNLSAIAQDSNNIYINRVDSLAQSLIVNKKTSGLMLAIKIDNAKTFSKEYGYSNVEIKKQVNSTDEFRIASVTKMVTAVAIMQLIEQKKLELKDTISKFFKDFPNGNKITIYQLLSHTSGIPNWWDEEGGLPENKPDDFPMCKEPHIYLQQMRKMSFFEPGTKYFYSNSEYVLLGEIIEKLSGMTYEAYLKKNIFHKAKMRYTEVEYSFNSKPSWAQGYKLINTNDTTFSKPDSITMPFAAGALRSNSTDLLKFVDALFNGELIKQSTLQLMTKYAVTNSGLPVYDAMFYPNGANAPKRPDYIKKYGYGLGFSLMEVYGQPLVWHNGSISGFSSNLIYMPNTKTTVVLLSNTEKGSATIWQEVLKNITKLR